MRIQLTVAYTQNLHRRGNIILEEVHIFSMSSYLAPTSLSPPRYPSTCLTYLLVLFSLCSTGLACLCALTRGVGAKKRRQQKEWKTTAKRVGVFQYFPTTHVHNVRECYQIKRKKGKEKRTFWDLKAKKFLERKLTATGKIRYKLRHIKLL
jgi:hypothetical protein